ncbi:FHA domain protein [Moritella sp. JT01]|uniref:FHA domain-containing protein n=1 Tax=Moritella sp. JT01 TaxID=756698 RepID=UPI00079B270E|nr:FHA domain-containing protein [Moritella sp. JT01]KXO13154.1 FHA domain protein [Moritella sp. JT01]
MAKIININTEEKVTLMPQHLFGRQFNASHSLLLEADSSRMHATIFWNGRVWVLQDFSRNGTYVNGKRIHRRREYHLHLGDLINFGSLSGEAWRIVELSSPNSLLILVTLGLPTMVPKVTELVSRRSQVWLFIGASSTTERLQNNVPDLETVEQVSIQFMVSQNEEHVAMKLTMGGQVYDLGQRNHHYLLLILARKRLEDVIKGVRADEQGWIDKELLSKILGQSENHINIQIYRFRKQIVQLLSNSSSLPQAIERRTREIRFAYDNVNIIGGAEVIPTKGTSTARLKRR